MAESPLGTPAGAPTGSGVAQRKFRINPVEVGVFSIVTLVFLNSVYNLFYDRQGFHPATLAPMATRPTSEGRSPASSAQSFANLDFKCAATSEQESAANKVRITGPLCTSDSDPGVKPVKTVVTNGSNQFSATVFTDVNAGKFSTDYIPLNTGRNPIQVEFQFQGGKTLTQELVVSRP